MEFHHIPVFADECMEALAPERGGIYVDCTAGGGGHSYEIAKRIRSNGRLISIDRDDEAIAACSKRLSEFADIFTIVKSNYSEVTDVLDKLGVEKIDGIMWDFGVSSHQLDDGARGFSYSVDAPLDMRMDQASGMTARDVVNGYSEGELARIIREYGEEKFFGRIAGAIVRARNISSINTTTELASIVASAIPAPARRKEAQHPARRTFQAIRIEVNGELDSIVPSLESAIDRLNPGGRAAVITFHSLEDRIVKQTFAAMAKGCDCPSDFPICVCGKKPTVKLLSRKPIIPSDEEIERNPRSRSAKLRCVEKI